MMTPEVSIADLLAKFRREKVRYLLFGYLSYNDETLPLTQFGLTTLLKEVSITEPEKNAARRLISKNDWLKAYFDVYSPHCFEDGPRYGYFALDLETGCVIQVGDHHYENVTRNSDWGDYTIPEPVFETFKTLELILEAESGDWQDETKTERLTELVRLSDIYTVRALAVNSSTPGYVLAQLYDERDAMTRELVKRHPNCPEWLQ